MATVVSAPAEVAVGPTKLLINNKWTNSKSGKTFPTINPATGEEICQVAEADAADVDEAVKAARHGLRKRPLAQDVGRRARRLMNRLADLIEKHADELARLETLDNGKPISVAASGRPAPDHRLLPLLRRLGRQDSGQDDSGRRQLLHLHAARAGGRGRTDHPLELPAADAGLETGPGAGHRQHGRAEAGRADAADGLRVGELILEAGFPEGVVNMLPGYGPTAGAAISRHRDVDKVAFTGSTEVGQLIMEAAAKSNLKRVTLELGGKSPNIVFADADLDEAVEGSHFALFFNQGQCCCAGSRLFVEEKCYDEFVERSAARAKKRIVGDPFDPQDRARAAGGRRPVRQSDGLHRIRQEGRREADGRRRPRGRPGLLHPAHGLRRREGQHEDRRRGDLRTGA